MIALHIWSVVKQHGRIESIWWGSPRAKIGYIIAAPDYGTLLAFDIAKGMTPRHYTMVFQEDYK